MPEHRWIFDTVVLSNFFLSDADSLLEARYRNRGLITWEVYNELLAGFAVHPGLKTIDTLIWQDVFQRIAMNSAERTQFLELIGFLGKGEATCIACAKSQHAAVVTDDRTARKQCILMDIPVTGTVGILKACVLAQQVTLATADAILDKMIAAGFYAPVRSIANIIY